ncbi:hypothetical protein BO85DRAFT_137220 [Aspergillus piperis CBS 112811]|uniref:Uncharacterized protein n=1 Tax=Aspergillus piperis CBS 112811 TaxID=1448313 RepID=A0A8G1VR34_9EURO|nr:hypothetical protein BO85DRAFT_137220 [Aspergillus piperis CBS 112811]RAH62481.1 hypothetical protein BO85DRAFT_137220 [Aspergillus piperis CBS 112811]
MPGAWSISARPPAMSSHLTVVLESSSQGELPMVKLRRALSYQYDQDHPQHLCKRHNVAQRNEPEHTCKIFHMEHVVERRRPICICKFVESNITSLASVFFGYDSINISNTPI